jgi:hypothetical protein
MESGKNHQWVLLWLNVHLLQIPNPPRTSDNDLIWRQSFFVFWVSFFWAKVSLCSPGWPETHDLPAMAGMCHHTQLYRQDLYRRNQVEMRTFEGGQSNMTDEEKIWTQIHKGKIIRRNTVWRQPSTNERETWNRSSLTTFRRKLPHRQNLILYLQPPEHKTTNFCFLSHPDHGTLL